MSISLDACTAQDIGDRKEQQDRIGLFSHPRRKGTLCAVVADGMGGHTGGALAAEQVVHSVRGVFERYSPSVETPAEVLGEAFREAHSMIRSGRMLNEKDPHSTVVALVLEPGRAVWGWCGDSRLYHFRGAGLKARSRDHSYVEMLLRQGRISLQEAAVHPDRNVLVTSLGGDEEPHLEYAESSDFQAGDSFLLCSDGLWGYFNDAEPGAIISALPARQAAERLIALARQRARGQGDNCSLVVLKLVEAAAAG
jgi:PPM family protein phosphatase